MISNQTEVGRVFEARFGSKYVIPAEHDVLINYAPTGSQDNVLSPMGKFRLRTQLVSNAQALWEDDKQAYEFMWREGEEPVVEIPILEPETNSTDNSTDGSDSGNSTEEVVVNWDGEVVPDGPWLDREAFTIGDTVITNQDVVVGSSSTMLLLILIGAICCYCCFRKRKRIAIEARRASMAVRRATHSFRRSMSIKLGMEDIGELPEAEVEDVIEDFRGNKRQKNFMKDFFHAQNQEEMES